MESKRSPRQLKDALDYAENIISTIREPILVLDADLRIISANTSFYNIFLVTPEETRGTLIYELSGGQWNIPKLRELLEDILPKNTSFENFRVENNFPCLGRRSLLLNACRIHNGGKQTPKVLLAFEDVTERNQAEHDIVYSELRYRRLFETAQDGILILNAQNGEITDANPFLSNMLGYSQQELLGKKLWEIGFFKDTAASRQAFQILQDKGYVRYEDLPLETKAGLPMEVEFVSNVYPIDGEKIIQCNIRDITDRKRVERNLEKTRLRMANILNSISDGFFALDRDFTITYFNPAAEMLLGRKSSEVLGHSIFEEAFREARGSIFEEKYRQVLKDKKPYFFETYFGIKPYENWYDVRAYPSEDGVVVFFQVTTERKKVELALRESEERFREMFESHQSIMLLIEPESGRIIDSNPAASEFYGYEREVLNKMNIADINQLPAIEVAKERQKALNKQMKQFLFPHRLASGEVRTVEVNSSPIKVNNRIILFSIIRDVTVRENALKEIKKLNESLVQRTSEIESINNELEAFSYSVSHDLKAPLRSISGFSNALLEDYNEKLDEQGMQYLNKIQESSDLMAKLIDDLLMLSRVTSAEANFGEINLSQIAQEVIAELQMADPKPKMAIVIAPNITVSGDRNLLKIALGNLLGNAWKFTSKVPDPRIEMGVFEQNGKLTYFVRDNGAGFDMTYADKLFKPFQRLHMTSDFPGTGIGLSIAQRIIRRHGGKIWAESKVGEGATFYFTLN
jgi:PAS domain S-box-containing protein